MQISDALENFVAKWLSYNSNPLPSIAFDSEWPYPCLDAKDPQSGETLNWRPIKQACLSDMFKRLGDALETQIHPDLVQYYSCFWSDHLHARAPQGELILLQVWNEEDFERLRSNLIGHAMLKAKQKQPLTFFFACTEPDNGILSLRNDDGSIWLEYPGKKTTKQIANNLYDFINQLTPC